MIDVIVDPGEAELVHFFRGALGCDTTMAQFDTTQAHIHQLTVHADSVNVMRLRWEQVTTDDDGLPYDVNGYIVWSSPIPDSLFVPIAVTSDTFYVDRPGVPRRFYAVQACGHSEVDDGD